MGRFTSIRRPPQTQVITENKKHIFPIFSWSHSDADSSEEKSEGQKKGSSCIDEATKKNLKYGLKTENRTVTRLK